MKKLNVFLLTALLLSAFSMSADAGEKKVFSISSDAKPVSIIYIHGAYENKDNFYKSVRNVHDDMIEQIEKDPMMYGRVLDNGKKKIAEDEIVFFWADKTEKNVKSVDKALSYVKHVGTKVAQFGRETLSHTLHDAVWISKSSNAVPLLNNLNEIVKNEYKKGNTVILYGYSAGSLLASQYLTQKMPVINLNEMNHQSDNSYTGKYFRSVVKSRKFQPTCLDALKESKILFYTDSDNFVTNPDVSFLKRELPKLDTYTEQYCAPQEAVEGFVIFGTPLTTFDSGASQEGSSENTLFQYAMKYIVEHDIFFLALNYENDFIGMPLPEKPSLMSLKNSVITKDVSANGGFIYDASGIKCKKGIAASHLAYWDNGKKFARHIVDSYNKGYKYFYSQEINVKSK